MISFVLHFEVRHNELLLRHLVINKLPLTEMFFLSPIGRPDLVAELPPLLAFSMFVGTIGIKARVEFTHGSHMREHTSFSLAVGTVPAHRHSGMSERAFGINAVGEEFAVLFGLVADFLGGGGVPADAFPVLAGSAEGTDVVYVNGGSRGCDRGLMGVWAVLFCPF